MQIVLNFYKILDIMMNKILRFGMKYRGLLNYILTHKG